MATEIKELITNIFDQQHDWKFQLLKNWNAIMGNMASKVQLEKIYEDTLVLGVYDSCWLQELYMLSNVLLTTINAKLDAPRIKHLRFKKLGTKKIVAQKQQMQPKILRPVVLNIKEQSALTRIKDPQLSEALKSFLVRCYQER